MPPLEDAPSAAPQPGPDVPGSRPLRRYERSDSVLGLLRAMAALVAGGVVSAVVWQMLSPMGKVTLHPDGSLPSDAPVASSDAWFCIVTAVWGVVAAGLLLRSWRRHPEHVRDVKETIWYWITWFVIGLLGVVTGLVLSAAVERLSGSKAAWELSTWVPLLVWPACFNAVVAVGSLLSASRASRPDSAPPGPW